MCACVLYEIIITILSYLVLCCPIVYASWSCVRVCIVLFVCPVLCGVICDIVCVPPSPQNNDAVRSREEKKSCEI